MKRRSFIKTSLAAVGSSTIAAAASSGAEQSGREFYELRVYSLPAAKQPVLDRYLSKAFIPALKRLGEGPVGVFVEDAEKDPHKVYVLIVHPSAERVATLPARLAADAEYQKAGAEYLSAPATDRVYTRIESSLLAPIEGMPRLARPDTSRPRLMNLRIYESHNEHPGRRQEDRDVQPGRTGHLSPGRT